MVTNNTQERIIQAALRLFARKGFEATSIRDIAQEAEINSATLYYYMNNKEEFLLSIMRSGLERVISLSDEILAQAETPEQQIAALVNLHVMVHGLNKLTTIVTDTEFRALHGENKEIIRKLRLEYEHIWRKVIQEGMDQGVFAGVNSAKLAAFGLLEMCTGVAHWYSPGGETPLETISEEYVTMALNLLGARRNGTPLTARDLQYPYPSSYMLILDDIKRGAASIE